MDRKERSPDMQRGPPSVRSTIWFWKCTVVMLLVFLMASLLLHTSTGSDPLPSTATKPSAAMGANASGLTVAVEWQPTAELFAPLEEPWMTGPQAAAWLTLRVRHTPQRPAICIMMVDSRLCDLDATAPGAQPETNRSLTMHGTAPSMALHYALLHRYDFARARIPADTVRGGAWYGIPMLRAMLRDYEYVMKMDGDSFYHDLTTPVESLIRQHGLDRGKALYVPRDIEFPGFVFPASNINAGILVMARRADSDALLDDWWGCPAALGELGWFFNWPAEQGCLWHAVVNTSRWGPLSVADWRTEWIGTRPGWIHHYTSGSYSADERNAEGIVEAARYFLHAMRETLAAPQARLSYSRYLPQQASLVPGRAERVLP